MGKKTGVPILGRVPEGSTYIRPFVSPKEAEERLIELPQFMRVRIAGRLIKNAEEEK